MKIDTNKPYKIFAELLEDEALRQFEEAMQQPCVVKGALMPDAHAGYTLPIGAVIATDGFVFPSFVGYDIGCGMCAIPTTFSVEDVKKNAKAIFDNIYRDIPTGFSHNQKDSSWQGWQFIEKSLVTEKIFAKNGLKQLGSLGSGNHFIEIGEGDDGHVWIVIHSGSRGIGHAVATYYMKVASGSDKASEGFFGLDMTNIDGKDYVKDMNFCLEFALQNRREMMSRVLSILARHCEGGGSVTWDNLINRNHNHAELKDGLWIHRKGATHAEDGMMGVIPGNMRDGCFIVRGKGNPDSLFSSSHGAGRVLGRKQAQRTLSVATFAEQMIGVQAKVGFDTVDESPLAYKNIFDVMEQQKDLVEVVAYIKPIINIKG